MLNPFTFWERRQRQAQLAVKNTERAERIERATHRAQVLKFKKEHSAMAMSKDRVRFFLPHRYFQEGHSIPTNNMRGSICRDILFRAFGIPCSESAKLMRRWPNGFYITCRPSQFARFIVFRHEDGNCINGIKDLEPEIIKAELDYYDHIVSLTGVRRSDVKNVIAAFGYSIDDYRPRGGISSTHELDVSKNPAQHDRR